MMRKKKRWPKRKRQRVAVLVDNISFTYRSAYIDTHYDDNTYRQYRLTGLKQQGMAFIGMPKRGDLVILEYAGCGNWKIVK